MIRASIDLGTNTCLLLVSEWDEKSHSLRKIVSDHATVVRLGQGVDQNRVLHPDAMKRTLDCLKGYSKIVLDNGADPAQTICVATSQARDAKNGSEFFEKVKKETGFRFRIISGDEEARYTFLGALLPGMRATDYSVIDIGGGSTEFMTESSGMSLDIGSVRFTERYLKSDPVTDQEFWACQEAIDQVLQKAFPWREKLPKNLQLLAVAGTATTLAAWFQGLEKFDPKVIESTTLTCGDVHRLVEELKWRSVAERQKLPGIEPGRADVLLAGALILWRSMEVLRFADAKISTRGLRFGIAEHLKA